MAGLEPTPPPAEGDEGLEALLALTGKNGSLAPVAAGAPAARSAQGKEAASHAPPPRSVTEPPRRPSPSFADERQLPTSPAARRPSSRPKNKKPKTDGFLVLLLVLLLGAGAAIVWVLKPGFLTARSPDRLPDERVNAEAERARLAATSTAAACKAKLTVTNVPLEAEVLLRVGQAPLDVDRMPIGARLEFVATAEGFAPKRTVVPKGVPWDPGPGGRARYEVAVQLDPSKGKPGVVDPWPAGEPGSEVGGDGPPGIVHIVSTPRGADVWLLAGIGPEAILDQLGCKGDVDVLVAGPKAFRKRVHVREADFAANPEHSVKVSAK